MIYICSWCPKDNVMARGSFDEEWHEITPQEINRIKYGVVTISHGLCPGCYQRIIRESEKEQ